MSYNAHNFSQFNESNGIINLHSHECAEVHLRFLKIFCLRLLLLFKQGNIIIAMADAYLFQSLSFRLCNQTWMMIPLNLILVPQSHRNALSRLCTRSFETSVVILITQH